MSTPRDRRPPAARRDRWLRRAAAVAATALVVAGCASGADTVLEGTVLEGETVDCAPSPSTVPFDLSSGTGALPPAPLPDLLAPNRVVCPSDWAGTPTVVNFWATWCGFCVEEMPDLQAASVALGGDVRFVGVDVQDVRDDALVFLDETGVTYEQVEDRDQGWYERLGNRGMPTTLFVDEQGTVLWRHTGPITTEQVLELVATHLGVEA